MSIEEIRKKNLGLKIHSVNDPEFEPYGRIHAYDTKEALRVFQEKITLPEQGNYYQPSSRILEELSVVKQIAEELYGGLPSQAGPCLGYNTESNGMEYHQGSETAIAVTDSIFVLGKLQDMEGNHYDLSKAEVFFVNKGQVVELYGTTLHYTPIRVEKHFATICILIKGTNETLEQASGILIKKNKYFITHSTMKDKSKEENYPGLIGEVNIVNLDE
jgi:hypothetical protein